MRKNRKLSESEIENVMWHFCVDVDAKKTSKLMRKNRKTIDDHFNHFRKVIREHQIEKHLIEGNLIPSSKIKRFLSFHKGLIEKFRRISTQSELHLKESEWRFDKDEELLLSELKEMLKKP